MQKLIVGLGLCMAISGCGETAGPVKNTFLRESGSQVDSGTFGTATMNNIGVQTGAIAYTESLAKRFDEDVPSTINFAFNSIVIDAADQQILILQADWIRQFPEVRFRVYGHTDAVGSAAYNKRLGLRRANAVVAFLSRHGINRSRLEAVSSFGETQPLIVSQGRERKNRRTVTQVSGFVKRHPTVMDGKYAAVVYRDYVESAVAETGLTGIAIEGSGSE
ncbi:MAG: peptidoglycan-associated lipoprotein [Paracoccaceae bacterium]|jgi:peptidoglycan-associated lipoprotein